MIEALMQLFGENSPWLVQLIVGGAILVAVLVLAYRFLPRLTRGEYLSAGNGRVARLGIVDAIPIDGRRQLVLVRRDGVEHLILTGGPSDVVIETAIPRTRLRVAQPVTAPPPTVATLATAKPRATAAVAAASPERPVGAARELTSTGVESSSALPFPFLPIRTARPQAPPAANGHEEPDPPKRAASAFAPAGDGGAPIAMPIRSASPDGLAAVAPPPPLKPASISAILSSGPLDQTDGVRKEEPSDADGEEPAAHKISALEAEMNRLLGQIAAERRSF
jgi:hypothetical protein